MGYLRETPLSIFSQLGRIGDEKLLQLIFAPYESDYNYLADRKKYNTSRIILLSVYAIFLAIGVTVPLLIYYLLEDFLLQLEIICSILAILLVMVSAGTLYNFFRETTRPGMQYQWKLCKLFRHLYTYRNWLEGIENTRVLSRVGVETPQGLFYLRLDDKKTFYYANKRLLIMVHKDSHSVMDWAESMLAFYWIRHALSSIVSSYEVELDCENFFHYSNRSEVNFESVEWKNAQAQIDRLDLYGRIFAADMLLNGSAVNFWLLDAPGEIDAFWQSLHNPQSIFYRYLIDEKHIPREMPVSEDSSEDIMVWEGNSSSKELPPLRQVHWE